MADLPVLESPLEDMNESELKNFIPKMLREATGRAVAGYGKVEMKPEWWPRSVAWCNPKYDNRHRNKSRKSPWKNVLKSIIKACYEHYGHEHMLQGGAANGRMPHGSGAGAVKVLNNDNGTVSFITDNAVVTVEDKEKTEFRDCPDVTFEAAIPSGSRTVLDPTSADPAPDRLIRTRAALPQQSKTDGTGSENANEAEEKTLVEIFICFFCEKDFKGKNELQQHQNSCDLRPSDMHFIGSPARGNGKQLPKRHVLVKDSEDTKPTKVRFVESLGLVPTAKVEKLKDLQNKGKEITCAMIEIVDDTVPKTPTTPRTPKLLISQLSRDVSPPAVVRRLDATECAADIKDKGEDNNSDCSKSENGEEDILSCRKTHSLLAIDISSALGQRIKKHIPDAENIAFSIKNEASYEEYCHTPVKNEFQSRLRHRDSTYPVTYRARRRPGKFCHEYCFTKQQRKERYLVLKTGLNKRSRGLKRYVDKCSVKLSKLSGKEIKEWTRRKPAGFLGGQHLLISPGQLQQVLRLHGGDLSRHGPGPVQFIDLSQFDSGAIHSEIQQQRKAIYNKLLKDSTKYGFRSGNSTPPQTLDPSSPLQQLLHSHRQQPRKNPAQPHSVNPIMSHMVTGPSHAAATPSNGFRPRTEVVDCDVISISSSDDEAEVLPPAPLSKKRKALSQGNSKQARPRKDTDPAKPPSALLFRCHMCHVEITCKQNAAQTIKSHFVNIHGVSNIDLVEHNDDKGQKVVSIVEVSVPKLNPATPPDLAQPTLLESAATTRPHIAQNLTNATLVNGTNQSQSNIDSGKANRRLFSHGRPGTKQIQKTKLNFQTNSNVRKGIHFATEDDDIICLD